MEEILNYIIFLENTLAAFYSNIKEQPRLQKFSSILEFMETHSFEHAEFIKETSDKYKKPVLDKKIIVDMHNHLTHDLLKKITENNDNPEVMKMLAESEQSLGVLYEKISAHVNDLSDYYRKIADVVNKIAKDEFNHSALLLKDREKLLEKKKK